MSNIYNKSPKKPIYAAVFTNQRTKLDETGYQRMAAAMMVLAEKQLGYLGIESIRDDKGFGITVSYWQTLDDIKAWKENTAHLKAQKEGQNIWYESYTTRIVEVDRIYGFLT
jgi:heme-degrading monooxygenase HmoA